MNIDFDEIVNNLGRVQSMMYVVALNVVGSVVSTTGNQVLIFFTYLGSLVYIWLKIKREFFPKKENNTKT
jgi:peroxiredoxin family protein